MAIKKTQLYSSLWSTANELRGGMDASSYKDYVLVILFVKYVTDKYKGQKYAEFIVPEGGSFDDMITAKGKTDVGEQMNKIISKLAEENELKGIIDRTDFDDSEKLGDGKEKVSKLSKLIGIFENPDLDFKKNSAEGDDILGDVYEYFMKNFAQESGKSKGQFYTPAEVSKIMAQIIGVQDATSADQTAYDPTCGSGSLLLKVASEAGAPITLYGQEKDIAVAVLAKMNMILHGKPDASITQGNTLTQPKFKENDRLKTFDFCVANPPFSDKGWTTGLDIENDMYHRFDDGVPPQKNGDYAYFSHLVKSLKQTGKGAIILPHGVLFRGNAEANIRRKIIKKGYIKGIIGLPANLFYGTGIPACILMIDKEESIDRDGIFMIDASKGFVKDGNKNRLRDQDMHKIVDIFNKGLELDKFSRFVPIEEIEKNEYNLNIPRYIDTSDEEDLQNIEAHLQGGIPNIDIDKLDQYWRVCPTLRTTLFSSVRDGFSGLNIQEDELKTTILDFQEFKQYREKVNTLFGNWREETTKTLKSIQIGVEPKTMIKGVSESLLCSFEELILIDKYDMYQHMMEYRAEIMQDDMYIISMDGWKAETYRIMVKNKKGKDVDKGWTCDLLPKEFVIKAYFSDLQEKIDVLNTNKDDINQKMEELVEEHSGDEGLLDDVKSDSGNITKANIGKRIKEIKGDSNFDDEMAVITQYLDLISEEAILKKDIKEVEVTLDQNLYKKYPELTEIEIRDLVVDQKRMKAMNEAVESELDSVSQTLTQRIKELNERYDKTLKEIDQNVAGYTSKVNEHLKKMGFSL